VKVLRVDKAQDFDLAFQPLVREPVHALLVTADPIFESQRDRIVALAAQFAVPTIYALREYESGPSVYLRSRHHVPSQLAGGPFFLQVINPLHKRQCK
jgi:hypothetical protein